MLGQRAVVTQPTLVSMPSRNIALRQLSLSINTLDNGPTKYIFISATTRSQGPVVQS